jgi:hypothetical protein
MICVFDKNAPASTDAELAELPLLFEHLGRIDYVMALANDAAKRTGRPVILRFNGRETLLPAGGVPDAEWDAYYASTCRRWYPECRR